MNTPPPRVPGPRPGQVLRPNPAPVPGQVPGQAPGQAPNPAPDPEPAPDRRSRESAPLPGDLARLWEDFLRLPFPAGFRGADVAGVDLILLDSDIAGLVQRELKGGLDSDGVAALWWRITDADKILPLLGDDYCTAYYARLRTVAALAATRHLPPAT